MKTNIAPNGYRYFHICAILFVASLLIGNTVASKIIVIAGFNVAAGILCFPIAYIVNDVLTEVYGYHRAKSVIWWGFISLGIMTAIYYLATIIEPAGSYPFQNSFEIIFGLIPRIAIASLIAYLIGGLLNAYVLSKMKVLMGGKKLWARTIGSTIIGEGVDSVIFNIIAFLGTDLDDYLISMILSSFILKSLYEIMATPLTYKVIRFLKEKEDIDIYDRDIDYSPIY